MHQLVDEFHGLPGIIDVVHQVADAVDDDQPVALFPAQRIVNELQAQGRGVFAQADKIQVLVVHRGGQSGQFQDAFQYAVAVEPALFCIHIEYFPFAFRQAGAVVQHLAARQ